MERISESEPMERKSKPERDKIEQERRGKRPECERKGERLKYERENKIFMFMFTTVNNQVRYTKPDCSQMLKDFGFPYMDGALFLGFGC